jgi:hypothetical protein
VIVDQIVAGAFAAAVGLAVAGLLLEVRLKAPPRALMRESVSGRMVPAVLGGPLTLGGMLGLVWLVVLDAMGWEAATTGKVSAAVAGLQACEVRAVAAGPGDGRLAVRVVEATGEVTSLEETLNRNLKTLAGSHHFEETVSNLAATIHLLNSRMGAPHESRNLGRKDERGHAA